MTNVKSTMDHKLAKMLVYFKGIFGIIELVVGIGLLLVGRESLNKYMLWLIDLEAFENHPGLSDSAARYIADHILGNMHMLVAAYMIVHGLVFITVVLALLHKKLWAFPTAGIVLTLFVIYQIYELAQAFSIILLILTLIDIAIIFFLRHEYRRVKLKIGEIV